MSVVVILGYGSAVGEGILSGFADAGYKVAIVSRTQSKLDEVAAQYTVKGQSVTGFAADLSKPEEIPLLIQKIASELGPVEGFSILRYISRETI
jgi:short-subunit dehydrogenase